MEIGLVLNLKEIIISAIYSTPSTPTTLINHQKKNFGPTASLKESEKLSRETTSKFTGFSTINLRTLDRLAGSVIFLTSMKQDSDTSSKQTHSISQTESEVSASTNTRSTEESQIGSAQDVKQSLGEIVEEGRKEEKKQRKKKMGRPKGSKTTDRITKEKRQIKAVELHMKGLSNAEVSRSTQLSKSAVETTLAKYSGLIEELKNLPEYRAFKTDMVDALQLRTLKSLASEEKQAKSTLAQAAFAFKVLNEASRLEKGQATSINQTQSLNFSKITIDDLRKDE